MKELINVGVDINLEDGFEILLIILCKEGYLNIVKELIKVGVDINFKGFFEILLIVVYKNGYF